MAHFSHAGICLSAAVLLLLAGCSSGSDGGSDDTTQGGTSSTTTFASRGSQTLSWSDTVEGYASDGSPSFVTPSTSGVQTVTVSSASELKTYAKKGNYIIYIDGMIDMTDGMLPSSWSDDPAKLGTFIASNKGNYSGSAISSWSAWKKAYAAYNTTSTYYNKTSDASSASGRTDLHGYQYALAAAWKSQIQINIASNTSIIGTTSSSGVKGGTFSISGVSNVMLRNLTIQDAFDPFPHHETDDGWNSEYDCITIQGTNDHIWIDHCTFRDTVSVGWTDFGAVKTGSSAGLQAYSESNKSTWEMWQTYDGLCDIKGNSSYVTVSNCEFADHDKVMLIGSSDSEGVTASNRTITLCHNYFRNCVQRLPMIRSSYLHNYNNYYIHEGKNGYDQKTAVNARYGVRINSENNVFSSGILYSYKASTESSAPVFYHSGDVDDSTKGILDTAGYGTTTTKAFTIPYTYTLSTTGEVAQNVPAKSGARYTFVKN